jgi:hypothetical protein
MPVVFTPLLERLREESKATERERGADAAGTEPSNARPKRRLAAGLLAAAAVGFAVLWRRRQGADPDRADPDTAADADAAADPDAAADGSHPAGAD